jgi:hypothetical protein
MNDYRTVKVWLTLGIASLLPVGAACTKNNDAQPTTASNGTAMANPPPPGYPAGYQGAPPPGYPAQPAYAQQPPGYPPQPGYPPPAQPAYTGPTPQPGYPPAPAYTPAQQPQPLPTGAPPAPSGSQTPPGPLAPTDPNTLQGIIQGIQGALQGQLVAPGSVPGDLTEAGLKLHAAHVAPGMQPDGSELKQNLAEGQHAVMMLTLQAGKCYSIVGFSPLGGVKDVDLNLLAPPFYLTLAGQDLTHNSTPVIGASPSPMCPVIAFPLQYKLDVFARSGSGQVLVQLYSKNK